VTNCNFHHSKQETNMQNLRAVVVAVFLSLLFISTFAARPPQRCVRKCIHEAFSDSIADFVECRDKCLKRGGFDDSALYRKNLDKIIQALDQNQQPAERTEVPEDKETQTNEEVSSDSTSGFATGTTVCASAGLNARWSPCGDVASVTTANTQGTVVGVVQQSCLGGNYQWVNIEVSGGGRVWIANVGGSAVFTCGASAQEYVTVARLTAIMPALGNAKANDYISNLNDAMRWADISSCYRITAFLAQLAHESIQLTKFEEIASGEAYEGRADLGNTQKGDGKRYKGRGPIQLTGRGNYRWAGKDLGVDLEGNPTLAATKEYGFKIAAWYWTTRSLNKWADGSQSGFDQITRRINGGLNGKADRDKYYWRARKLFGC
jgi:predicted chitinase